MPTSDGKGDFINLNDIVGRPRVDFWLNSWKGMSPRGCNYMGETDGDLDAGRWWGSSFRDEFFAWYFYFCYNDVCPVVPSNRASGFSLRCLMD